MFGYNPYYHQTIRKMVISFGKLFSDLTIERINANLEVEQVIKVPIAYGPKEKWLRRLQENPDLSKQVKMELPRMSFEITNYQYDPERKLGPNQNYLRDQQGRKVSTPIPYNITMVLYIATRTQDDMLNIMEQILPFFSPAVTLHVKILDDPLEIIETPIIINSIQSEDNWDDDFNESRLIVNTITFTMKTFLFGPIIDPAIIKRTITDIAQRPDVDKYDSPMDSRHTSELNPFAETNKPEDPHSVDEFFINW